MGLAGLAVFRSELTSQEKRTEVRKDLSRRIMSGASNVVPFPSDRIAAEVAVLGHGIFLGSSKCVLGKLGFAHPWYGGKPHPSTLEGLDKFIARLRLGDNIKPVSEIDPEIREGSAAIFGGPVSTWEARLIFGKGGRSPILGVPLPFSFRYWDRLTEAAASKTELWELIIDGVTAPAVRECVIVTVLPMGDNDRIISIAGLHGAGTLGIDLVLRDRGLLDRLERETRNLVGWQFLGEVVTAETGLPVALGETRVCEIKAADFDSIRYSVRSQLLRSETGQLDPAERELYGDLGILSEAESAVGRSRKGTRTAASNQEQQSVRDPSTSKEVSATTSKRSLLDDPTFCRNFEAWNERLAEQIQARVRKLKKTHPEVFESSPKK